MKRYKYIAANRLIGIVVLALLTACANKPCRQIEAPASMKAPPVFDGPKPASEETTKVFKYDGSKQCGQGGMPVSIEEMAKQLSGIKILAQNKQNDGRIYPQVCGGSNGSANVYEIKTSDLPKALEKGFKVWKF